MFCQKCKTPNHSEAVQCFNCGEKLIAMPAFNPWKNDAYILVGMMVALFALKLPYVAANVYRILNKYNDAILSMGLFYKVYGYISMAGSFIIYFIGILLVKNQKIRIFLAVLLVLELGIDIFYRFLN
jgi:uncharacterized paraquat-inducible protein A